jgi:ribonuclease BN (tRNA processing enzyme)
MQITVVGCAGSFPGPDSPASCYLVEHEGSRIILDLGNGSLGALQRYVDPRDIDAVLLTHLHVDHCIDLASYYVYRHYFPGGALPPIPVFGPGGTAQRMAAAYGLDEDPGMTRDFDFRPLGDGGGGPARFDIGPFTITTTPVVHPVEAYAIRVDAGGGSVVYSGDTAPTRALVDLAHGADVALFEASYVDGAPADGVHLTARQAGEHAAAAEVAHLVLTHLVAWNDPGVTEVQGRDGFGRDVTIARPGLTLSV